MVPFLINAGTDFPELYAFLNQLGDLYLDRIITQHTLQNKIKENIKWGQDTQCCLPSDIVCFAGRGDVKQSFGEDSKNIFSQ